MLKNSKLSVPSIPKDILALTHVLSQLGIRQVQLIVCQVCLDLAK